MRKLIITLAALALIYVSARAADVTNIFQMPATTCTSQFVRSIATITGIGTCASIVSGDLSSLAGQYPGVTTNTVASAGNIGEIITATLVSGSATALVNNTAKTVTSISLTAGEWDVTGVIDYLGTGTTTVIALYCSISQTNNTLDATMGNFNALAYTATGLTLGAQDAMAVCPTVRKSLSTTTTIFLIAFSSFGVSTNSAAGFIRATRVH